MLRAILKWVVSVVDEDFMRKAMRFLLSYRPFQNVTNTNQSATVLLVADSRNLHEETNLRQARWVPRRYWY